MVHCLHPESRLRSKKGFNLTRSHSEAIARIERRGFNLIEAAIVLGVVGLVIGAIWTAAAHFSEEYKVNKTVSDIELIVKNTQKLISGVSSLAIGNGVSLNSTLMGAGAVPKDWISGNTIKNPFGGVANFANYTPSMFGFCLQRITTSACVKLAVRVSSMGAMAGSRVAYFDPNLGRITIQNSSWVVVFDTSTFPISPDANALKTACSNVGQICFTFGYTRIN